MKGLFVISRFAILFFPPEWYDPWMHFCNSFSRRRDVLIRRQMVVRVLLKFVVVSVWTINVRSFRADSGTN